MNIDEVHADLSAFADDERDVAIDNSGTFVLSRAGQELSGRLFNEGDTLFVQIDDETLTYRSFLTRTLGRLDVLATRLLQRKGRVPHFVEGPARIHHPAAAAEDASSALRCLQEQCEQGSPFATRIAFVTADAGLGKTALLQELQARQANKFLNNHSSYVLWHLDLQGRQLLRLDEALMGDLGELRMLGLWMPSIIRLLRCRALVLAIDGFDELSAEQGSNTSLGALASIATELGGDGTIIAAARRTFFDTEDYLQRAGMVQRSISAPCEFVEIALRPWTRVQAEEHLDHFIRESSSSRYFESESSSETAASRIYKDILFALGNKDDHPILTRPFLLSRTAREIITFDTPIDDFIRPSEDQLDSVASLVNAFIRREVAEKWKNRVTGEPYLTELQHRELLGSIAEEMYQNATDRLPVEVIDMLASMLLESWGTSSEYHQQVVEMVRMHVLLIPPSDGASGYRSFDHPEFRDYFVAFALSLRLRSALEDGETGSLARFLSVSPLSDSTARYVIGMLQLNRAEQQGMLSICASIVENEARPTYVQPNVGTLLPFLLSGSGEGTLHFDARAITSSISWEGSRLQDVTLRRVTFVNASLQDARWDHVTLDGCQLGDLSLNKSAAFKSVVAQNCQVDSVRITDSDEALREFSPKRIASALRAQGINISEPAQDIHAGGGPAEGAAIAAARTLLSMYRRTTVVKESQIRLRQPDADFIVDVIIPIAVRHEVVAEKPWRGGGRDRLWTLTSRLDKVLSSESLPHPAAYTGFWNALRKKS